MRSIPKPDTRDEHLTIAEAAEWSGRSESWVRTWRASGPLVAVEIDGKQGVTLDSLRALLIAMPRKIRRPRLRLVVDNSN